MKYLAIIPARKNSHRLRSKNKKKLMGTPLIEYTIKTAKKINLFENILVSTDDNDIIKIAKKNKVLAPWIRPKNLSGPKVSTYRVVKHALDWYENEYKKIDAIFLLQPTSPFRTKKNIEETLKLFKSHKFKKSIISISKSQSKSKLKNSKVFVPNGLTYLISKKLLLKYRSFINKDNVPYLINNHKEAIDIDYPRDWAKAIKMLQKKKK